MTPLIFSLAACAQTAPKTPATTAAQTTSSVSPSVAAPKAAAPDVPAPAHPITDPQIKELMELTGTDKIKQQLVENVEAYFKRAAPPFMPADVSEDLNTTLQKSDVNTPVVAIYKKYLSTEDAAKAIEFYKTPAGHDLIKATPQILGEAQRTASQTGQQVMHEVIERHRPEIEAAQKAYQAQHAPPQGPSLGAPTPGMPAPAKPVTPPTR